MDDRGTSVEQKSNFSEVGGVDDRGTSVVAEGVDEVTMPPEYVVSISQSDSISLSENPELNKEGSMSCETLRRNEKLVASSTDVELLDGGPQFGPVKSAASTPRVAQRDSGSRGFLLLRPFCCHPPG